jgi:hypothetical protein
MRDGLSRSMRVRAARAQRASTQVRMSVSGAQLYGDTLRDARMQHCDGGLTSETGYANPAHLSGDGAATARSEF